MRGTNEATIEVSAKFSSDGKQRYCLTKIWNSKKRRAMVICNYPSDADGVKMGLTELQVTNNLYELGYGGFTLVNIFSQIGGPNKTSRESKTGLQVIKLESEGNPEVIIATGTYTDSNQMAHKVLKMILDMIDGEQIMVLTDKDGKWSHPLRPSVRKKWYLTEFSGID
ncbi:DUF1643 domain-containing protein [Latilactobacillus sakei]